MAGRITEDKRVTHERSTVALRHLRNLYSVGTAGGLSDQQLLERFKTGHREAEELAFTALIERHGPMVLRVCRGVLGDAHDAQDAFQATFLVLARKAGSLSIDESLAPWLHAVALRVATRARTGIARRRRAEQCAAEWATQVVDFEPATDLESVLHEEVGRLPEKYRARSFSATSRDIRMKGPLRSSAGPSEPSEDGWRGHAACSSGV